MTDTPIPAINGNGSSEEIKDAAAALRSVKWLWNHKKDIGVSIALGALLLKGDTSILALVGLAPQKAAPAAVVYDAPVSENWKSSVDRRLGVIEKQQKTIIKLLTE